MMRDQKKMKKREREGLATIYTHAKSKRVRKREWGYICICMYVVLSSGLAVILSLGDAIERFDSRTRTFTQGFFNFFSYTRHNNMNK